MAQVIYSGNGSTAGTVPVDSNTYVSGGTVTVANNTGSLSIAGEVFLYWNTAADGSGTIHTGGSTFTLYLLASARRVRGTSGYGSSQASWRCQAGGL